jgi:protein-S-isoprenylcysteine O-methyltransferase Ste14
MTNLIFACGLTAGLILDLLLLRTFLAPSFRIWPTPEPGSWQSLTFWGLFRGTWLVTFVVAALDWNATPLLDWTRYIVALPLGLTGLFITVCGYFNLGLGNTYCGEHGLVTGGLYRFSRNPQYAASIMGLIGLSIGANSILTIILSMVIIAAYVLMALVEEECYGAPYRDYVSHTARFLDIQGLIALVERKKPCGRPASYSAASAGRRAATTSRAASSTSMPAPSRCARSASTRRNARARGCPWNSPRICRVI